MHMRQTTANSASYDHMHRLKLRATFHVKYEFKE